jgi:hypothetical protein
MAETEQPRNTESTNAGEAQGRGAQHHKTIFRDFMNTFNLLERVLLFMAKAELFVLQYCTRSTRMTLTSVGAMVVITGILAFSSSLFAIKNSFFYEDTRWIAIVVPTLVASLYAGAIMAFDREIVAATDKRAAWMRIPFAFLIGIVISFPIELQLQHGRVVAEIDKMADIRNENKINDINNMKKNIESLKQQTIQPLLAKKDSLENLLKQELESAKWERQPEHGLCRGKCEEHMAKADDYQKQLDQLKLQTDADSKNIESDGRLKDQRAEIKRIEGLIEKDKKRSHDLLSQAVALHSIYKSPEGSTAETLGWFLRLFFVCFELFPVLIKMTMPYTEYHAYLEARNRLIVNKLIGASNHKLAYYRDNPDKILADKTEVTDMLVDLIEDREIDNMRRAEDCPNA